MYGRDKIYKKKWKPASFILALTFDGISENR